ncbi:MAG TPA: hypothetical protein PK919_07400 [Candidatus Aminicenantes bacterium]|nr:hypothetical protein [Candidatus Aminicenantes bacterium]
MAEREHRRAAACHLHVPASSLGHFLPDIPDFREQLAGNAFQIVAQYGEITLFQEELYFTGKTGPCQAESGENQRRGHGPRRQAEKDRPRPQRRQPRQLFADPLPQRRAAAQEEGHVGAEAGGHLRQLAGGEPQAEEAVEEEQHHGGVAAAAAEAGAGRYALAHEDLQAAAQPAVLGDQAKGAGDGVGFVPGHARVVAVQAQPRAGALAHLHAVAEADGLEDGAQRVVAVVAAAGDLQPEVDLGEGAQADHRPSTASSSPARKRPL